jgi:predicted site-specific integrase-resolvase
VPDEELLTTAQAADLLGRPIATVNRWAAEGKLNPAMKLPTRTGANLFRRSDILALLVDQAKSAS